MRAAFIALDVGKNGAIVPKDLRFYLTHWGLAVTEEKFEELFNYFDAVILPPMDPMVGGFWGASTVTLLL